MDDETSNIGVGHREMGDGDLARRGVGAEGKSACSGDGSPAERGVIADEVSARRLGTGEWGRRGA